MSLWRERISWYEYFLPEENSSLNLYNNGLVSEDIAGVLYINFKEPAGFDIKGLMIEFGDSYPNMIEIEWDNGKNLYKNENGRFITEDVYEGVTFLKIIPVNMETRLRIFEISGAFKSLSIGTIIPVPAQTARYVSTHV